MIAETAAAPPPVEDDEQELRCPKCGKLFATGTVRRLVAKCPRCKAWNVYYEQTYEILKTSQVDERTDV
jgi:phage FluMu protein Com